MSAVTIDEWVQTLVDEVLTLQADLAATRAIAFASLSGDPVGFMDAIVRDIDAYTLPLSMTEEQRDHVRIRLDDYHQRWMAFQRVLYPGGWRGVLYAVVRTYWRFKRAVVGFRTPARL